MVARCWGCDRVPPPCQHREQDAGDHKGPPRIHPTSLAPTESWACVTIDTKLETKTMLVPISWLKEYVDLILPIKQLADRLTLAGLEGKGIERVSDWGEPGLIGGGQIITIKGHPNAQRLVLVDVDYVG